MINCKNCGKLFTPKSKRTKVCSYECKKEYGYSIYKNEKEGKYFQDKPVKQKTCKQCGETFKTQTNRNYCYKGCTSVLRQGKAINKEQLTIKTATMAKNTKTNLDFMFEDQPTSDSVSFHRNLNAAEKDEIRVFNLLKKDNNGISVFSFATVEANAAPCLHKAGQKIPLPDIFIFKKQKLVLVEVKSRSYFFFREKEGYICSINENEHNRYKLIEEETGARVWLAFVVSTHEDKNKDNPAGSEIKGGVWTVPLSSVQFWNGKNAKGEFCAKPQYKYNRKLMTLLERNA